MLLKIHKESEGNKKASKQTRRTSYSSSSSLASHSSLVFLPNLVVLPCWDFAEAGDAWRMQKVNRSGGRHTPRQAGIWTDVLMCIVKLGKKGEEEKEARYFFLLPCCELAGRAQAAGFRVQ